MALAPCRECTTPVSDSAATCPSCGISRPDAAQAKRATAASIALVVLLSVLALGALFVLTELVGI